REARRQRLGQRSGACAEVLFGRGWVPSQEGRQRWRAGGLPVNDQHWHAVAQPGVVQARLHLVGHTPRRRQDPCFQTRRSLLRFIDFTPQRPLTQRRAVAIALALDQQRSALSSGGAGIGAVLRARLGDGKGRSDKPAEQLGDAVLEDVGVRLSDQALQLAERILYGSLHKRGRRRGGQGVPPKKSTAASGPI